MQWIFVVVCFFGTVAASVFVKSLDLHGGLKAAIIVPLVFLAIYSLARIKPKQLKAEKSSSTYRIAEPSEEGAPV